MCEITTSHARRRPTDATRPFPQFATLGQSSLRTCSRRACGGKRWRRACECLCERTLLAFALLDFVAEPLAGDYMLRSSNELKDYSIAASDGDIGQVEAFCFDDIEWTVRYIVVNTGGWLHPRKVLISPFSIGGVDAIARGITTDLTREEVKASPQVEANPPASRRHKAAQDDSFDSPQVWGFAKLPRQGRPRGEGGPPASSNLVRSTREFDGFTLAATDGEIGHVDDFIIDDETWTIRYLVVDTRNWWPGKKVTISPLWISAVDWQKHKVNLDLSRNEIRNSPEYDDTSIIDRDYEERLYEHYGQTGYWAG